jgi:hypothetical protein
VAKYAPREVQKAKKHEGDVTPKLPPEELAAIAEAVNGMDWAVLVDEVGETMGEGMVAQAGEVLAQLGTAEADVIGRVNERVIAYARERAAEMVGMKRQADGSLVPNPSARWRIDETTREGVRDEVTAAFEKGMSREELAESLTQYFDADRAEMIAAQEMKMANSAADMSAWRESGIEGKRWLLSDDHKEENCPDDICGKNAEEGVIPLEQPFSSGDMAEPAHIGCECSTAAEQIVEEESEETDVA